MVELTTTNVPHSNLKEELARVLKESGYLQDYKAMEVDGRKQLRLFIKYQEDKTPVVSSIKRISKCGRRVYYSHDKIPRILRGMGVIIMSTPKGLMTDHEARKIRQGGEALISVW